MDNMEDCKHLRGELLTNGFPHFLVGRCEEAGCDCVIMYSNRGMTLFNDRVEIVDDADTIILRITENTVVHVPPEPEPEAPSEETDPAPEPEPSEDDETPMEE